MMKSEVVQKFDIFSYVSLPHQPSEKLTTNNRNLHSRDDRLWVHLAREILAQARDTLMKWL